MDWAQLIADLVASGMSQTEIGQEVIGPSGKPRGQSWVSQVSKREIKDVRWLDGQVLLVLHARRCQQGRQMSA